jgi:hypothetical protein
MKKTKSLTPIAAAVLATTGCVPMEPVEPVVQDDDGELVCTIESSIGSHVKEETCTRRPGRWETDESVASDGAIDDDSSVVFRTVKIERFESRPIPLPEAKCGSENSN